MALELEPEPNECEKELYKALKHIVDAATNHHPDSCTKSLGYDIALAVLEKHRQRFTP